MNDNIETLNLSQQIDTVMTVLMSPDRTKLVYSFNPFMPTGAFNICCPRDCVSGHNGEGACPPFLTPPKSMCVFG